MKKLLALLLAVIMLIPAAACSNDVIIPSADTTKVPENTTAAPIDTTKESEEQTTAPTPETTLPAPETTAPVIIPELPKVEMTDLSSYTMIGHVDTEYANVKKAIDEISTFVKDASGITLPTDSPVSVYNADKKEILIGKTNRPETKGVLDALGEHGYAVKTVGNKIVIVGNDDYATAAAINYFTNEILKSKAICSNGKISIPKDIDHTVATPKTLVLAEGKTTKHTLTYTKNFIDRYEYSYYDYSFDEKTMAAELVQALNSRLSLHFKSSVDIILNAEAVKTSYEILLGNCDRDATREVKAELDYNEYAIKVVGNKVVVTGLGLLTTYEAMYKFIDILEEYKDGNKYVLPTYFEYIGVYEHGKDWIVDIPEYNGGKLDSVSDVELDGCSYVIKIKETTLDEYNSYLSKLVGAGYKKYTSNEIDGNRFTTYTSDGRGTLRVQFIPAYSQTNIIVESSDVILPGLESENKISKATTPKLVQLKISNEQSENGQCHIFRLSDGRFIVFDGGSEKKSSQFIYNKLAELNVLPGNPVIAAWIFTHHHGDHTGSYQSEFSKNYFDKVEIQSFIYSFPAEYYLKDAGSKLTTWYNFSKATKNVTQITPHTGDVWYFGDLKMTCIYTQADALPDTFEFYNDSSSTFMFEIGGQKILITGDASENSCNTMLDMFPNYLKCDILQVPHHGHFGANNAFMDATNPWVALIPASYERWTNKLKKTTYAGAAPLRYLLGKKTLKEYYVHGQGTVTFDLPYSGK